MGPSSRVGSVSSVEDVRNKRTRRLQSAPITTRSSCSTSKHRKDDYQHVEHRSEIRGAAAVGGRRNTSFFALVRGLVSRR